MSIFTPTKLDKEQPKVHYSQYIKTENKPDEAGGKPAESAPAEQPETK